MQGPGLWVGKSLKYSKPSTYFPSPPAMVILTSLAKVCSDFAMLPLLRANWAQMLQIKLPSSVLPKGECIDNDDSTALVANWYVLSIDSGTDQLKRDEPVQEPALGAKADSGESDVLDLVEGGEKTHMVT